MELYVDQDTDRMRSTFTAIGLASLFYYLLPPGTGIGKDVRLTDLGSAYRIYVPYSPEQAQVYLARNSSLPPLIPAIKKKFSGGEQKELAENPNSPIRFKYEPQQFTGVVADYETEQGYALPSKSDKNAPRVEGGEGQRSADYPLWAHLSSYFGKGSAMRDGYPNLLHTWHAHEGETAGLLLNLILDLYGDYSNDIDGAANRWKTEIAPQITYTDYEISSTISALAVVSPSTSKGLYSETAASGLGEDTPKAFWLPFYFAFAGYMVAGMPFTLGTDVALYYPLPHDISFDSLRNVMKIYRGDAAARALYRFSSALPRIKLDVLAHIAYYRSMVEHFRSRDYIDEFDTIENYGGFVGYYYKYAGGTQIPFDETVFALPHWLPHVAEHDHDLLNAAKEILDKHYELIDHVRGKPPKFLITGDELVLLDTYRRFIASGERGAWIEFTIAYNRYYFQQIVEQPSLRALTLDLFRKTLLNASQSKENTMNSDKKDYSEIFETPGFQQITAAIRECTVSLIFRTKHPDKEKRKDSAFTIRYGLGDDLLRNAHEADLFVAALTEFVHDFQRETYNVLGSSGEERYTRITPDSLQQVVALIPEYSSPVVARLLVAAGYCTVYGKSKSDSNQEEN